MPDTQDDDFMADLNHEYATSVENIRTYLEMAPLPKPTRCKFSVLSMLAYMRHSNTAHITETPFNELLKRMLSAHAWAVRAEFIDMMLASAADKGEFDVSATQDKAQKSFDASLLELSKYIDFVSLPLKHEKERPQ